MYHKNPFFNPTTSFMCEILKVRVVVTEKRKEYLRKWKQEVLVAENITSNRLTGKKSFNKLPCVYID